LLDLSSSYLPNGLYIIYSNLTLTLFRRPLKALRFVEEREYIPLSLEGGVGLTAKIIWADTGVCPYIEIFNFF
jgi:hypothetical protein